MGTFGPLILIAVAIVSVMIVRQYLNARNEQRIRLAPLPAKKVIEVRLPRDVTDANSRMRRFFGRVASVTANDPKLRAEGLGQLDLIYLADRPPNFLTPVLRFFIVADERAMPTVKRALKTAFEQQAEVFNVEVDPLADVFEQLRARALAEVEQLEGGAGQPDAAAGDAAAGDAAAGDAAAGDADAKERRASAAAI
jgi:hypothetical protein